MSKVIFFSKNIIAHFVDKKKKKFNIFNLFMNLTHFISVAVGVLEIVLFEDMVHTIN